ncbi:hypothetical protein NIES593_06680 [Hydrococcus rivularis NIES-593]|uniref:Uncharacterized protein n=1 Tax=Hydrococcus rivularis NIES-593 TaxID=1921803 RepID=A0A1U7HN00_9CYAN|nr:DUF6391 domain-containing protein [Hydrococcus rivularis]OKH24895.1 hypothetical protein NIES593_06680 [Hydrococcus rivularis NIES-593]
MTNSAYVNTGNAWDLDLFKPQPTQDSEFLKLLGFLPGLKEILMLRQVHALEHATVWVLSETSQLEKEQDSENSRPQDNETLGGLSTDRGFYLYGQVSQLDLQRAVRTALQRLQGGEWDLAVHPRCGTNLSVSMLLTAGLALGAHFLLPRGPIEQLIGLGLAATVATQLAPDLGLTVQKYLTTAIPFNLTLTDISATKDLWGRSAYFVAVQWQEPQ